MHGTVNIKGLGIIKDFRLPENTQMSPSIMHLHYVSRHLTKFSVPH